MGEDKVEICECGQVMELTEDVYRLPVRQWECSTCHQTRPTYGRKEEGEP